jgi:hypothetical protein
MARITRQTKFPARFILVPIAFTLIGGGVWFGVKRGKGLHSESHPEHADHQSPQGAAPVAQGHPSQRRVKRHVADDAESHSASHSERHSESHDLEATAPRLKRKLATEHDFKVAALPVQSLLPQDSVKDKNQCGRGEFQGPGLELTRVDAKAWSEIMNTFHAAKADLLAWLDDQAQAYPSAISPELKKFLETEVRELRVQRPPTPEEPDLAYRGILALTTDADEEPLIRVGSGMLSLLRSDPERARFEFTRVLAQRWSPCVLAGSGAEKIWSALVACSGVHEEVASSCAAGGFSELGWVTSTALAARVSAPGCVISGVRELQTACAAGAKRDIASPKQAGAHDDHAVGGHH